MEKEKIRNLLTKEPFKRIKPRGISYPAPTVTNDTMMDYGDFDVPLFTVVSQSDFLREFFPSGHKINDPSWYPDKTTYNDSDEFKKINGGQGAWVTERVARCSFPLQAVITIKQLIHLCGNNIMLKDSETAPTEKAKETLIRIKQGWIDKNMEVAWWESARGEKITGDVACVYFLDKGKLGWKILSFEKGDKLYPHYNNIGRLEKFARQYYKLSEDGTVMKEFVEVWDDSYAYLFEKDSSSTVSKVKNSILDFFGLDGYKLIDKKRHGFPRIPVSYKRSRYGACWSFSQSNIDDYELGFSMLCENNKAYAFPILVLLGDGAEIRGMVNGRPYAITSSDPESKVDLLGKGDASQSFTLQLDTLLKAIFLGSFTVIPPEPKSGDLPGAAIKLIYSPALEKAMADAQDWNLFIDDMVELFTYGYGIETGCSSDFNLVKIKGEIVPYVHENTAEVVQLLSQSVLTGVLSVETATAKNPFAMSDEYKKILQEKVNEAMGEPVAGVTGANVNAAREAVASNN